MDRPQIKDKATIAYVTELEEKLSKIERSPYLKSYITLYSQIESFNEQLTIKEPTKTTIMVNGKEIEVDVTPGKIDLFADKDSKEFDRAKWVLLEILGLCKQLDEIRKLLLPEEVKVAEQRKIVAGSAAEKYIFKEDAATKI